MCIAIYKPKGEAIPTKKVLRTCFQANDDGAGFMVFRNGAWDISKGHMSFRRFWKAFRAEGFTEKDTLGIHFRIGTSGGLIPALTHPFPITRNVKKLKDLSIRSKNVLMHNGVLGSGSGDLSDTMVFIRDIVFPLYRYMDDPEIVDLINRESAGSRLFIARGGRIELTGNWIKDGGVFYSNDSYKPKPKKVHVVTYKGKDISPYGKAWEGDDFDWNTGEYAKEFGTWKDDTVPAKEGFEYDNLDVCPSCGNQMQVSDIFANEWGESLCIECGDVFDEKGNILYNINDKF